MTAVVRMALFHTRRMWKVTFFVQLLLLSTLQVICLQALAAQADFPVTGEAWIRAALTGMWMVSTVSAGIVGFQRFQGTLVHMMMSPRPAWQATVPIVLAVSTFGLFSIPTALAGALLLGLPVQHADSGRVLVGLAMFWVGSVVMASVVASVFVLALRHYLRGAHRRAAGASLRGVWPPTILDVVRRRLRMDTHGAGNTSHLRLHHQLGGSGAGLLHFGGCLGGWGYGLRCSCAASSHPTGHAGGGVMVMALRASLAVNARSSNGLASVPAAIVSLLATPLLQALIIVAVAYSSGVRGVSMTAQAAAVAGIFASVVARTAAQMGMDQLRGIVAEVSPYGLGSPALWLGKAAVAMLSGVVTAGFLALMLTVTGQSSTRFVLVALATPIVALPAAVACALASLLLRDPLSLANLVPWAVPVTAGTVISVEQYPVGLSTAVLGLPGTWLVRGVRGEVPLVTSLALEAFIGLAWLVPASFALRRAQRRHRDGFTVTALA